MRARLCQELKVPKSVLKPEDYVQERLCNSLVFERLSDDSSTSFSF